MNKSQEKKIWVLYDGQAGNVSQVLGVAEALNLPYTEKKISLNAYSRLPNIIRRSSLIGINLKDSSDLYDDSPDILINAGSKAVPLVRFLKKRSGNKTITIQIMGIRFYNDKYIDLIFLPEHEKFFLEELGVKIPDKVIFTHGAPHRVNEKLLYEERKKWVPEFSGFAKPLIAVLLGGSMRVNQIFTDEHALDLANKLKKFAEITSGTLLITTSRRTSESAMNIIVSILNNSKINYFLYDYKSGGNNPYYGYLALSDIFIVSGESVSMCSEACSTGKPVYLYITEGYYNPGIKKFHESLYKKGCAKIFKGIVEDHNTSYEILNESARIAKYIKEYCSI